MPRVPNKVIVLTDDELVLESEAVDGDEQVRFSVFGFLSRLLVVHFALLRCYGSRSCRPRCTDLPAGGGEPAANAAPLPCSASGAEQVLGCSDRVFCFGGADAVLVYDEAAIVSTTATAATVAAQPTKAVSGLWRRRHCRR